MRDLGFRALCYLYQAIVLAASNPVCWTLGPSALLSAARREESVDGFQGRPHNEVTGELCALWFKFRIQALGIRIHGV